MSPRLTDRYGVRSIIPEGERGDWRVKHFTVSREQAERDVTRAMIQWSPGGRFTPAGDYTGLMRGKTMVMSDTPDEIRDHLSFIKQAQGHVLIHGLGLGMCAAAALHKPEVRHVTVVEAAEEVIELVGRPLAAYAANVAAHSTRDNWYPEHMAPIQQERLTVVHGDALTWKPPKGSQWDVVWHDIWDYLCADNLEDMKRLHRRFGRRTRLWQGSWGRELCEYEMQRIRRQEKTWS